MADDDLPEGPADWPRLYARGECRVNPEETDEWPTYRRECPACAASTRQRTVDSWGGERFGLPFRRMIDERECGECSCVYLAKRDREGM